MPAPPPYFDADLLERLLDVRSLVDALSRAFARPPIAPPRTPVALPTGRVILMPAWYEDAWFGLKLSTVFRGNARVGLPTVSGTYVLIRAVDGTTAAVMDGRMLTLLRTAAASALASRHLSRADSEVMAMIGTGELAQFLVRAHASVRPVRAVRCWGRRRSEAERLADRLRREGFDATASDSVRSAVEAADIVSVATLSEEALVAGRDLAPGTHLDLVGAFTPTMRECDALAVSQARVFVDTRHGAREEAGDLIRAVAEGAFGWDGVDGDLHDLVTGGVHGRRTPDEHTLFKSVGTAIEDLAAAVLALDRVGGPAA